MSNTTNKLTFISLFIVYLIIFVSWVIYRYTTHFSEIFDETVAKPLIWICPVILVLIYKKIPLSILNLKFPKPKLIMISIFIGIGLALLQIIPNLLKGNGIFFAGIGKFDWIVVVLATLGTAISEEIVFRGFLLQQLKQIFSPLIANITTSFLFALIHIPILIWINHSSGLIFYLGLYAVLVASLIFGALFIKTKNLSASIIAHFINNLLLTLF